MCSYFHHNHQDLPSFVVAKKLPQVQKSKYDAWIDSFHMRLKPLLLLLAVGLHTYGLFVYCTLGLHYRIVAQYGINAQGGRSPQF